MKNKLRCDYRRWLIAAVTLVVVIGLVASCQPGRKGKTLTLAINSGVEGDALRQAAKDYEQQTGVHIEIAEFPYANLFEKELIDLNSRTGAYDLIMLDDPWFPKFASLNVLTDLGSLLQQRGPADTSNDFLPTSLALPSKTVDRVRQLAARELADNAEFRRLVRDLGASPGKSNSPNRSSVAAANEATQMANP